MTPTRCPYCQRMISTHQNRWGETVLNRHMIGAYKDRSDTSYQRPYNYAAATDGQIACPGSSEPVEEQENS